MGRPVVLLDPLVAQRIAAGEVIERPHSVVRELIDNAVDSDATQVDVYLEQGGIDGIRVIDNGSGMTPEDLSVCCKSHATSKISKLEDLERLHTLGFRGEALASIAACSDMRITTGTDEDSCWVRSPAGEVSPGGRGRGTMIEVRRLFHEIPGRKKFLKSSQAEASACKRVFLDKALPFPEIQFRLFAQQELKQFLPSGTLFERVMNAYGHVCEQSLMKEGEVTFGKTVIRGVYSDNALYRTDRSYIQIFVNRRRINDYSLVQAVTHGYSSVLPGGAFPYCFLFLDLPPEEVDFNIHPAKREVRFRSQREVHHLVTSAVRQWAAPTPLQGIFERRETEPAPESQESWFAREPQRIPSRPAVPDQWHTAFTQREKQPSPHPRESQDDDFIYHGQIFNLFLLAQRGESLYIIDQHAAHERFLYDQLSDPTIQPLLVPLSFTPEHEVHQFLLNHGSLYQDIGITLEHQGGGTWEITTLPSVCRGSEEDLLDFIAQEARDPEQVKTSLYAMIACKSAVKDGEILDPVTAKELIRKAFSLEDPRCPHGRPVWREITREELFRDVRRTVTGRQDRGNR